VQVQQTKPQGLSRDWQQTAVHCTEVKQMQEFLQCKRADVPGCIVLDVRLPGTSGLEFQRTLADLSIQLPVIFISGYGDISMSVRAMKSGAMEFLT
jgi:FixJ family two-component response regulator